MEVKQTTIQTHFSKFVKVMKLPSRYPDISYALCSMIFHSQMIIYINLKYGKWTVSFIYIQVKFSNAYFHPYNIQLIFTANLCRSFSWNWLTDSIEQNLPWGLNTHLHDQEILHLLWNLKVHYCVHKSPELDLFCVLSHHISWRSASLKWYFQFTLANLYCMCIYNCIN
jgi:hypothetical protein